MNLNLRNRPNAISGSFGLFLGFLGLGLCLTTWTAAWADVESGPAKDANVPELKVFAVVGMIEDKEVDYASLRGNKTTVYVFVKSKEGRIPEAGRPAGRFLKELDKAIKDLGGDAYIVAVWLTDDGDQTKEYLPLVQTSLQFEATALTYYPGDKTGPMDWAINADANVTVVIAARGKVVQSLGYLSVNETDVPKVVEIVKKLNGNL